jgi:hypothetical protein
MSLSGGGLQPTAILRRPPPGVEPFRVWVPSPVSCPGGAIPPPPVDDQSGDLVSGACTGALPRAHTPCTGRGYRELEQPGLDVGAVVPANREPLELVQPGEGAFHDPAVLTQPGTVHNTAAGDHRPDAALLDEAPVLVMVLAAVSHDAASRRRGRPGLPRTDGTASNSGMSCVTSLRLPPVSVTASAIPWPSTSRWRLLPGRARSTGLGPIAISPFGPDV